MGCIHSAHKVHAYYDPSGELVNYVPPSKHSAKKELVFVTTNDTKRFRAEDSCYLISTKWHATWLDFVTKKTTQHPLEIENYTLLTEELKLRKGLKTGKDFRPINQNIWEYLFCKYGGGPVITLTVPAGLQDEDYWTGTWIKRVDLSSSAIIIVPNEFPKPVSYLMTANPMSRQSSAEPNLSIAGNYMLNDLSKSKFKQAKAVQEEINATNAEALGALMAKDLGKQKMAEAKELEAQENTQKATSFAHHFAGGLADKKLEEARKLEKEKQLKQSEQYSNLFAKGNIKAQFKEALKNKDMKKAQLFAATMLKNAWKTKKAREHVKRLKIERQRLFEDGMIRKIQSKYRARLARRKVEKLKAEKQRLREEGCAIMLQSCWRIRKARQKVEILKAQKQRLLEEGAALKVQSKWRIRQAMQKVGKLKETRSKQKEAALKIRPLFLMALAFRRRRKLLSTEKSIFIVTLKSAKDINIGDINSSDPYVLMHGENLKITNGGIDLNAMMSNLSNNSPSLCLYRSKVIYNTLHPVWNEELYAPNITMNDSIVLTLMDKDNFTSDDFLGQVIVPLGKYPQLYRNKIVELPNLTIDSFQCTIRDLKGKQIPLSSIETPGKGIFDINIQLANPTFSQAGWIMKLASQMIGFGSSTYKPRYFMLVNQKLTYYDDEQTLDRSRDVIDCAHVTELHYGPDQNGHMTLQITSKDNSWYLHWMENESQEVIYKWLRKIQYSCPRVGFNQSNKSFLSRINSINELHSNHVNNNTVINAKSSSKVVRRASSMFGIK